jgi:hypothetical protein
VYLDIISDLNNLEVVVKYRTLIENLSDFDRLSISLLFFSSVYLFSKIVDRFRRKKVIIVDEKAALPETDPKSKKSGLYEAKKKIKNGLYIDKSDRRIQKRKYRLNNEDFKIKYIKYSLKNIAYNPNCTGHRLQNKFYKA